MSYLTTADRQRIVDKMMSPITEENRRDNVAMREIAESCWHDMALIEPVLEEIIHREAVKARRGYDPNESLRETV